MAGRQVRDRAAKAASEVDVRLLSRAAKAKRPLPSKAAVTLPTTKANQTSIAKTQTARQLPQAGRIVQGATVRTAVAGIAEAGARAVGIAEEAVAPGAAAIAVLVVAVIAETAKTAISH